MAAALRSVGQYKAESVASGSAPIPYPTTVAGDLLGCIIWQDSDGAVASLSAASGWAQTGVTATAVSASTPFGKAFLRTAAATGTESGTLAWPVATGASTIAFLFSVSGADVANPISGTLAIGSTTSASPVFPAVGSGSLPAVGDLLICSLAAQATTTRTQTAPPSGMAENGYQATSWNHGLLDTQVLTTAGPTGTRTATMSGSGTFRTLSLAIAQSVAAPSGPEPGRFLLSS